LKLEVPKVTNPPKFVADKNELKILASRKDAKGFFIILIIILCGLASLREQ